MIAKLFGAGLPGLLVALSSMAASPEAADVRTGSRVGSKTAKPLTIELNPSGEVDHIHQLLDAGKGAEAVQAAREYVASFEGQRSRKARSGRYYALNALCVALTKTGALDEAIDSCTQAIDLAPHRWTAINNRGTARFAAHRFEQALADYRRARDVAPKRDANIQTTIDHNIALTQDRLEENK